MKIEHASMLYWEAMQAIRRDEIRSKIDTATVLFLQTQAMRSKHATIKNLCQLEVDRLLPKLADLAKARDSERTQLDLFS